jgi:hypothetical protein
VAHSRLTKTDAEVWGKVLTKLSGDPQNLGVSPERIVLEAKKKSSPLHSYFLWDVKKAAKQHWLSQARYFSRSVAVVFVEPQTQKEVVVRAFHSATSGDAGQPRYFSLSTVLGNDALKAQVLKAAHIELQSWLNRYRIYDELAAIAGPVDQFLKDN